MEDRELITAVISGDVEAFGPLMDRYYAMVYRLCLNMSGNAPDADELAHDSFVEAYLKLGQLRDPDSFGGWLKTLTLNLCRMWYRQNRQRFTVELEEDYTSAATEEPDDRSVYQKMSHGLAALTPAHRLVLVLHYYEGLSYEEIARFLEVSKGTVMSRLHRARQSLKEVMTQMTDEYQDIPAAPDDRFKEVVQAEIDVLLKMFDDAPSAEERLTIVLRKSPERLVELVATAEPKMTIGSLAVLLPYLGGDAIDIVLDCCFSGREPTASNARELLRRYAARCGTIGHRDGMPDMPSRDAYSMLDRLITHSADDAAKASVLLDMMESCAHPAPAILFANVALSRPDAVFPRLCDRFERSQRGEEPASPMVLHALVRTGARFARRLVEMLESGDSAEQSAALVGCEAIARSLCPPWLNGATREQFLNDVRTREKWPPLRTEDIGIELLAELTSKTAEVAASGAAELRAQAVRVLGYLGAADSVEIIRGSLSDSDPAVRLAAIFSTSEIGDAGSSNELIARARDGEGQERAAAVTALGRLQVASAEAFLVEMTRSPEEHVRSAAVVALGEMGTVSAVVAPQGLMRSGDSRLQKLAAKAVFGGVRTRKSEPSEVDRRLAEKRRKVSPVAGISPDAVLRFGLTELRSYDERDLTERIAGVCGDYCATRRYMIEFGLMTRSGGLYEFTESGKSAWRVERTIVEEYLAPSYAGMA